MAQAKTKAIAGNWQRGFMACTQEACEAATLMPRPPGIKPVDHF
jgi:hypothetical protein